KSWIVPQIALPEPARFGGEPETPFQPRGHHPAWRLRFRPCDKIKSSSHSEHHRSYPIPMLRHPEILLGRIQPDEKYPRAGVIDFLHDALVLFRCQRPERWRTRIRDWQP